MKSELPPHHRDSPLRSDEAMTEEQCLRAIADGASAYELLAAKLPHIDRRFHRLDRSICKLLADVRKAFPDAEYYTASGGFNLLLGHSHSQKCVSQAELIALSGGAQIGDGDF